MGAQVESDVWIHMAQGQSVEEGILFFAGNGRKQRLNFDPPSFARHRLFDQIRVEIHDEM